MADNELTAPHPSERLKTTHATDGGNADTPTDFFYPNRFGRIVLISLEDVLGLHGVNAVLNLADMADLVGNYPSHNLKRGFRFSSFGRIQATVDLMFGMRGGRGLNMRAGRESFKYVLSEFMPVLGIADLATRALPLGMKLKIGLNIFAESFNKLSDQQVRLGEDRQHYYWNIMRCPICWERTTDYPCCSFSVGLLEQALYWVSNGRIFHVHETRCHAAGDPFCEIVIRKRPEA